MTLAATAVTGSIEQGDIFKVKEFPQQFQVALDAAFAGNSVTVSLTEPVRASIPASSDVKLRQITLDWLPLPGRSLPLGDLPPAMPDRDLPPIEQSVRVALRERDGHWHCWKPTLDLTRHGSGERVFVVDRGEGLVRFGDGYTGRQPVLVRDGLPNARVRYWVGGGSEGNIGTGAVWVSPTLSLRAKNVVDAVGGAEAQTPEDARANASRFMTEVTRAVTESDYKTLATTVPGVAIKRAHAVLGAHPCYPCRRVPGAVTVFVVPDAPRDDPDQTLGDDAFVGAPVADRVALTVVRKRLDATRLIGTEVFVAPVPYRPVRVLVQVRSNVFDPGELQRRLLDALRTFLDPLRGGAGDGWPFGESVRPSALLRRAQDVIGESGEVISLAIGLDGAVPAEACADIPIRAHELVFLDGLELRLQDAVAARAGLR
jgi:predicted phage baseplate assembly protein